MHCRARDTDSLSLPLALGSTDDMHDDALDEIFLMEYILRENGSAPERMSTYNESFTIYIEIEIDRERERETRQQRRRTLMARVSRASGSQRAVAIR